MNLLEHLRNVLGRIPETTPHDRAEDEPDE
jgi:hypothetical protein